MMATYNGEKYVAEQIDSILAQEGVNVTLLISDDGSSDSTPSICSRYAQDMPMFNLASMRKTRVSLETLWTCFTVLMQRLRLFCVLRSR